MSDEKDMKPRNEIPHREMMAWEINRNKIDLHRLFRDKNQKLMSLQNKNHTIWDPELMETQNLFWRKYEARIAHGYPLTAWWQLGLLYGAGLYTAREQGLVKRNVILTKFWKFHYFDWITFMRRGLIYAWAGGLISGTIMFGLPDLSIRRAVNAYNFLCGGLSKDIRNSEGHPGRQPI